MNILLVTPYFPPEGGGLEKYALNVSLGMQSRGHEVTVVCGTHLGKTNQESYNGITVIRQKPDIIVSNTPVKAGLYFTIRKLLRQGKYDLVNAHTPVPYYADMAALASRAAGTPFVLTYHNDIAGGRFPFNIITWLFNRTLNPLTVSIADLIITASPYCYRHSKYLKKHAEKLTWIPPGVDVIRYSPGESDIIRRAYNLPESARVILFVGQMNKRHTHKGVDDLIRAFVELSRRFEDTYLAFVGGGDMIPEYRNMCESLGIGERAVFTGYVEEDNLADYYRSATMVVLPSTTAAEGFGMTLIEGNACGKPVIGTAIGGIQYIVNDKENGLLVAPGNPGGLAGAMTCLLEDAGLRAGMGETGRNMAERYSWDRIVTETENVYRTVLERAGAA